MGIIGGPRIVVDGFLAERHMDIHGEWVKLFRHNSINSEYFSNSNIWEEARFCNPGNTSANKYSILTYWDRFLRNGKYTLKLDYPNNNITNIWSQTSNPVIDGSSVVQNYVAIDIDTTTQGWGGLERLVSNSNTFLDGTVNSGNWYYAVGCASAWGGVNTYPGPGIAVTLSELWILDKPNI